MNTAAVIMRKRWPVLAAIVVLMAVALAAGTLFAANERQQPDVQPSSGQLPSQPLTNHETDPGLTAEYRALVAQDAAGQDGSGVAPGQVVPGTGSSDALTEWLDEQPDKMGFITQEDALTADADTMDWLLYQAVYKEVLTQEEADAVQAWYERRPSADEVPELLNHQPVYLDRPGDEGSIRELFQETDAR